MIKKIIKTIRIVLGSLIAFIGLAALVSGDILAAIIILLVAFFVGGFKLRTSQKNRPSEIETSYNKSNTLDIPEKQESFINFKSSVSTGTNRITKTIPHEVSSSYLKLEHLATDVTVFDFETTGFDVNQNEIIQIGAIKFRNNKIIDTFERLAKPQKPISSRITKLTGITNDMVKDAPPLYESLEDLMDFMQGEVLVAHNASFDMKFLLHNLNHYNIDHEPFSVIDTLKLARDYIHDTENHKLATLKNYLKIEADSHNSIEDCRVTGALYYYCKELVDSTPGYFDGRHFTEYVDEVKNLKREKNNSAAIDLLLNLVNEVEKESKVKNWPPAPWYFEQLAILYRKEKQPEKEIAILERYLMICAKYGEPNGAAHSKLVERLNKLVS